MLFSFFDAECVLVLGNEGRFLRRWCMQMPFEWAAILYSGDERIGRSEGERGERGRVKEMRGMLREKEEDEVWVERGDFKRTTSHPPQSQLRSMA